MCRVLSYMLGTWIKQDRQAAASPYLLWLSGPLGETVRELSGNRKGGTGGCSEMGLFNIGCLPRTLLRSLGFVSEQNKNFFPYRSCIAEQETGSK